jgi:hypothetical protein
MIRFFVVFFALALWQPINALAQPTVLAELFCNVNCANCPTPDNAYGNFLSSHPGVALIKYHNSDTDPNDLFYTASKPASQDRDVFYGGPGGQNDPSASIDGVVAGSEEAQWETYTNLSLEHPLPSISSSLSQGPNGIDTILFTVTGTSSTQVVYYVAIKESQIFYSNTEDYGNPPGNLWNDVFRTMLPAATGSMPFSFSGTHKFSVVYDPSQYLYNGNEQNMTAVIFVQDEKASSDNNYQVEAIDTVSLASSAGVTEITTPSNRLIIHANPISSQEEFAFELASAGDVQLNLYDMLGRQVRTLVEGMMPSGQTTVDMNGNSLPPGCYIARLVVNGQDADQAKFIAW